MMASAAERVTALQLSAEQMAAYQKKFNAFDLNNDGVITMREFAAVSQVFGYKLSKEEIMVNCIQSALPYSKLRYQNMISLSQHSCGHMTSECVVWSFIYQIRLPIYNKNKNIPACR